MGSEHFDLVMLDIEMPGMNGFQLAKRIGMERGTPCLIFVSAHESFVFDAQALLIWEILCGICLVMELRHAKRCRVTGLWKL